MELRNDPYRKEIQITRKFPAKKGKNLGAGQSFLLFYGGINMGPCSHLKPTRQTYRATFSCYSTEESIQYPGKEGTSVAADKSYANRLGPRGPITHYSKSFTTSYRAVYLSTPVNTPQSEVIYSHRVFLLCVHLHDPDTWGRVS
eukprot:scaffold21023_cov149-Skeletonema_marinoi.AAC.1